MAREDYAELPPIEEHRWHEWNVRFQELQFELDFLDTQEEVDAFAQEVGGQLDQLYPYLDHRVTAKGPGISPVLGDKGEPLEQDEWSESVRVEGIHQGFALMTWEEEGVLNKQISHKILIHEQTTEPTICQENIRRISVFLECATTEIIVHKMMEVAAEPEKNEEPAFTDWDLLSQVSNGTAQVLATEAFRLMERSEQNRAVYGILESVTNITKIRGREAVIDPVYAYVPTSAGIGDFDPLATDGKLLIGQLIGFAVLESGILEYQPIVNDEDMIDMNAGLCLVFEPDEDSAKELGLAEGNILYVPTNSQDFNMAIGA